MMLSFIMPAYKAAYLEDAIRSIVGQTVADWELVVVDDCSPEDLRGIVSRFDDPRIRYVRNSSNIGGNDLVAQWNHCISMAQGDWIALAADDDEYAPDFCGECLRLAAKYPGIDVVRSRVLQIDGEGRPLWEDAVFPEYTDRYEFLHDFLTGKTFACIGNYAFRRSALLSMGGFINFPCAFGSDIATPIALSGNGVANTSGMLFSFRQSAGHLSADRGRFKEKLEAISLLSEWIADLDYGEPELPGGKAFLEVHNPGYLHAKCVYDYFNLVIRHLELGDLLPYLKCCRLATAWDKFVMSARWMKRKLFDD